MKIAVNFNRNRGPSGGGNGFLESLIRSLQSNNHEVYFDLNNKYLDLILILDPRWNHQNAAFNSQNIVRYLKKVNENAIVVHRINECDERKGTKFMNKKLRAINYIADSTIYVGSWLKNLDLRSDNSRTNFDKVILNGSDKDLFNSKSFSPWAGDGPLKLVTHHWSNNKMKGFDVYQRLDDLLSKDFWTKKFLFTYIGNLPKDLKFRNIIHVPPLSGLGLARELSRHHGYVTASINEPGGNHQNEGALCGLPLLYRDSGCMPEYCSGYGISFNESNFEDKLIEFQENYSSLVKLMPSYPHTASNMTAQYLKHFDYLLQNKAKIISERNLKRNLINLYRLYFPI